MTPTTHTHLFTVPDCFNSPAGGGSGGEGQHHRCSRPALGDPSCTHNEMTFVRGYLCSFVCNTRTSEATTRPPVSKGVVRDGYVHSGMLCSCWKRVVKISVLTRNDVLAHCQVKEARWRLVYIVCYLCVRKEGIWKYIGELAYICMKKHWKDKQNPNTDAYLSRQRGAEVLGVGVGMTHLSACIFLYCVDFLNHAENHQPMKVNLCGKALLTLN